MTRRMLPLLVAAVACSEPTEVSPYEAGSLEPARVFPGEGIEGPRFDAAGVLHVVAGSSGTDFALRVGDRAAGVDVFTPTGADLAAFDGLEVRLALAVNPDGSSLAILDGASGEPLYLLETVTPGSLTTEAFGTGMVAVANDLGPVSGEAWSVDLRSAWLRTDTGDLELLPGEPAAVAVDGKAFRAVLLSSYDVVESSGACSFPDERLSYELLRTDASVDPTPLVRDPAASLVGGACSIEAGS